MNTTKKKILIWSTSSLSRARYKILFRALESQGFELIFCNIPVWDDLQNKTRLRPLKDGLLLFFKHIAAYFRLFFKYLAAPAHDVVLVPYVSQLDLFFIKPLAFIRRKIVIADIYISIYDTVVNDRKILRPNSFPARIIYFFERISLRIADRLFIDTAAHARQVEQIFHLPPQKIHAVFVGTEVHFTDKNTLPGPVLFDRKPNTAYLLFYGNLSPLHGVETIVQAASILSERNSPVHFLIIGEGQLSGKADGMIAGSALKNITRISKVEYSTLPRWISQADICLGVFAANEKTDKVIPNKVFQVLASGKPLITADTSGLREILDYTSMDNNVFPIPSDNANLLADKILDVLDNINGAGNYLKPVIIGQDSIARQFERIFD